jgi:hypothetical protein
VNEKKVGRFLAAALAAAFVAAASSAGDAPAKPPRVLEDALKAHGGLKAWQRYAAVEFDLRGWPFGVRAPLNDRHRVDLRGGRTRVSSLAYNAGSDGREVWAVPSPDALGLPAEDYLRAPYRVFAMPFRLGDAGAGWEPLGRKTLQGRPCDVLRATFDVAAGTAAAEGPVAYFDAETHRLRLVHYAPGAAETRSGRPPAAGARLAALYGEWQTVDGLSVPRQADLVAWVNEAPGEKFGSVRFENVRFDEQPWRDDYFRKPAVAPPAPRPSGAAPAPARPSRRPAAKPAPPRP